LDDTTVTREREGFSGLSILIHPSAEVSAEARIGAGSRVWHQAQIRERASIGQGCIIGKGVYIDFDVAIGDHVKIQNYALIYHGATIEGGVFVGPGAILANDCHPRAVNPDGSLRSDADWEIGQILIRYGASLGAGSVILPGVVVGSFALVAAGAVVTRDVPDHGLVVGNPARIVGYACVCGRRLQTDGDRGTCPSCNRTYHHDGSGMCGDCSDAHVERQQ